MADVRKGQYQGRLSREAFRERFLSPYRDPAFQKANSALAQIEVIAWDAYQDGRKSPSTHKAGAGFADPDYDLADDWRAAREAISAAQSRHADPAAASRVLVICASPRNDGTCPGEISKTYRMTEIMQSIFQDDGIEVDLLDLSRTTSEYGMRIHPCKACVSTAMPLCHWPCSCYPNYSLGQTQDWMNEIYAQWTAAHAVVIVTPVHWYQATSPLKLLVDRLVCADGGNPDPTSTQGKKPELAKELELKGWNYPKHLSDRVYGLVVHGDVAGIEGVRRSLSDWLDWMGMIDAGSTAKLDRFIGYYEPYATSHKTFDEDLAMHEEVRNVARAVAVAVGQLRAGTLSKPDRDLKRPRPK